MRKGKFEKKKQRRPLPVILLLVCSLTLLAVILLLHTCGKMQGSVTPSEATGSAEKNPDSIAIPGYEALELKAGSKKQTLCLPNPEQNMCYFQISLYLEDDTLLWQSGLIEPGEISKPMTLTQELEKGTYLNTLLRYDCYRMDETLTLLNGAEMKVTLWVK